MAQHIDLFAEFQSVSKAQWLEHIDRELKGKPLDELYWQLNKELSIDPFGHADDQPAPPAPLNATTAGWQINEDIGESKPADANRQALEALAFGVESLHFLLDTPGAISEMDCLLDRIHLNYIGLHFSGNGVNGGPAAVLSALDKQAGEQGLDLKNLQGSLFYDPAAASGTIQDWRYLADLLSYAREKSPAFRCITVDGRPVSGNKEAVVDELATLLRRGGQYLSQLGERGIHPDQVAAQMQFSFCIGESYFVEIARLRAFKLLWLNMLKAWDARPVYPLLDIRFAPGVYTDDLYTNMIRATTMAMSAVLGGADRLTILPYDAGRETQAEYPRAFARRIARNVQHLLKLESGFDSMADPAAGSYYIEKLTFQLAEAAWRKLDLT